MCETNHQDSTAKEAAVGRLYRRGQVAQAMGGGGGTGLPGIPLNGRMSRLDFLRQSRDAQIEHLSMLNRAISLLEQNPQLEKQIDELLPYLNNY